MKNRGMGASKEQKLDDNLIAQLKNIEHVRGVTPILNVSATLKSGKYQSYISITGIDPECIEYFDFPELADGEYISNDNPTAILFGAESCYFFNPKQNYYGGANNEPEVDLMNDAIKITFDDTGDNQKTPKYNKLNVAGVLQESTGEFGYNTYAPIEQVTKWYKEMQKKFMH